MGARSKHWSRLLGLDALGFQFRLQSIVHERLTDPFGDPGVVEMRVFGCKFQVGIGLVIGLCWTRMGQQLEPGDSL